MRSLDYYNRKIKKLHFQIKKNGKTTFNYFDIKKPSKD